VAQAYGVRVGKAHPNPRGCEPRPLDCRKVANLDAVEDGVQTSSMSQCSHMALSCPHLS
jgi:hypothetical protein